MMNTRILLHFIRFILPEQVKLDFFKKNHEDTISYFALFFFLVYSVQPVNPRIRNVTAAAAETYANISWEYEGPDHENIYVEYGVAGSKKMFHWILFNTVNVFQNILISEYGPMLT